MVVQFSSKGVDRIKPINLVFHKILKITSKATSFKSSSYKLLTSQSSAGSVAKHPSQRPSCGRAQSWKEKNFFSMSDIKHCTWIKIYIYFGRNLKKIDSIITAPHCTFIHVCIIVYIHTSFLYGSNVVTALWGVRISGNRKVCNQLLTHRINSLKQPSLKNITCRQTLIGLN